MQGERKQWSAIVDMPKIAFSIRPLYPEYFSEVVVLYTLPLCSKDSKKSSRLREPTFAPHSIRSYGRQDCSSKL